jgi:hypothetical protein
MEKEAVCMTITYCSKFTKEACLLLMGEFMFATIEFLWFQQVDFLSNLCWNPWRGVERLEGF